MIIFHHNDIDGFASAAILKIKEDSQNINFVKCNYNFPLTDYLDAIREQKGQKVYIVDYSFKENTVDELKAILNAAGEDNVIWIDHHACSLDVIKYHRELENVKGLRKIGVSAAALCWMYFNYCSYNDCPQGIKLISDYDTWTKEYPDTDFFNYGLLCEDWENLTDLSLWNGVLNDINCVNHLIDNGRLIYNFEQSQNKKVCHQWSFETKINGIQCLAINRKTTSEIFGRDLTQYPLYCVFQFNGTKWFYSIYSEDESVDCNRIASLFGGGGHKGAAGFSSDSLILKES